MAKILVAENSRDWQLVAQHALGDAHQLTFVPSLVAAKEQVEHGAYDLVILDLGLDDSTGDATFIDLTAMERMKGIPVLIVTGAPQERFYGPLVLFRGKHLLADYEEYQTAVQTLLGHRHGYQALQPGEPRG